MVNQPRAEKRAFARQRIVKGVSDKNSMPSMIVVALFMATTSFPCVAPPTYLFRRTFTIIWCFPWCSEIRLGERPGVILPAAQWHESAVFASKEPPMGGKAAVSRTDVSQNDVGRDGTSWHELAWAVAYCIELH